MPRSVNFDDWFLPDNKQNEVYAGVELELLLFDAINKEPLQSESKVEQILHEGDIPYNIYKDFYPHQLEIRTSPSNNPSKILKETLELYKIASEKFSKHKIYIIPAPAICTDGFMYCGMHIHLSYPECKRNSYFKKAMGIYPFALSLADHTKNIESGHYDNSLRMKESPHIGLPYLKSDDFFQGNEESLKYKDVIFSPRVDDGNRSHMGKPSTIEFRLFDTPSLVSHYELILKYMMGVASRIKDKNPIVKDLTDSYQQTRNSLINTRDYVVRQRYAVNKIFMMLNSDVCEDVCDHIGVKFPRETQFEFREKKKYSADVNGFISMAIEGGWL